MSKVNFLSVTLSLHHITCYIPYLLTSHHVSNLQSQTQGHSQFLHLLLCTFYFSTQWSPDSTESTSGISLLTLFFIHTALVLFQVLSLVFLQCSDLGDPHRKKSSFYINLHAPAYPKANLFYLLLRRFSSGLP